MSSADSLTRRIAVMPAYGGQGGEIEVVGCEKYSWLRLHPSVPGTVTHSRKLFEWCVDASVAKALRDALIELYPLPVKPVEPKVRYKASGGKVWRITPTVKDEAHVVGEFYVGSDAEAFAAMKNAEVA
jgi:hypothetical protein